MERDITEPRELDPNRDVSKDDDRRTHHPERAGRARYSLSADERQTMADIGRFRTVTTDDLTNIRYKGNQSHSRADLKSLLAQGLVQSKSVWTGRDRETDTFLTLTKAGKRFLQVNQDVPKGQAIFAGFVKPAELRHDAAIYRMYDKEAALIEKAGGRITRVVLDYELKQRVYSPLAKARLLSDGEYKKRQAYIAQENGLKVVNGHITLPDLRIEYTDRAGVAVSTDLEVASKSYHGSHAAEKAAAGFTIYAEADTAAYLSRVLEEREITAEILSL